MSLPTRLTSTLAAGAVLTGAVLLPGAFRPAEAAPTPQATSALAWLAGQVDDAGGIFVYDSGFGDFTDYGLTLDADLALALGGGHASTLDASMDEIDANLLSYVTDADFGDGSGRFAGSLGKALLAEQLAGRATVVDGFDLEAELRARIQPSSDARRAGRLSDAGPSDFSNGFGQALGMLALARTSGGIPDAVLGYLLAQQCPNGGFRSAYDVDADFDGVADAGSTRGCTANAEADVDATTLALEVLLARRTQPGVPAAITSALAFLEAEASAPDNSNTAGLLGQSLRAAGHVAKADSAAAFVTALQLTSSGPDTGAIAFDNDAKSAAPGSVIDEADLPQFWRATAQGVLALGLGSYGPVVEDPASTTTSTTVASSSTTSTTRAGAAIPRTGSSSRTEGLVAALLIGVGLMALGQAQLQDRRRRP